MYLSFFSFFVFSINPVHKVCMLKSGRRCWRKKEREKKSAAWNVCQLCRVGGFIFLIITAK